MSTSAQLLATAIVAAIDHPGINILAVAPTHACLRAGLLRELDNENRARAFDAKWLPSPSALQFPNGSRINFRATDRYPHSLHKLGGTIAQMIVLDEPRDARVDVITYEFLESRIRYWRRPGRPDIPLIGMVT